MRLFSCRLRVGESDIIENPAFLADDEGGLALLEPRNRKRRKQKSHQLFLHGASVAALWMVASVAATGVIVTGQTTAPSPRSSDVILNEIETAHRQFKLAVKDPSDISDPDRRKAVAPQAIAALKTMVADFQELAALQPQTRRHADQLELQFDAFLAVLGDQPTIDHLQSLADSKVLNESLRGQCSQILAEWVQARKDQLAQEKLTNQLDGLDHAHPQSEDLTFVTVTVSQSTASKPLATRLMNLAAGMQNPTADKVRAVIQR